MQGTTAIKPWVYSHTQLALWKQCKRRYYQAYMLGNKEPTTPNMAAGTWLAQEPIECWEIACRQVEAWDAMWETTWANFLAEFGGDDSYDDPIFTIDLAKKILKTYKANPVQGKVVSIEETFYKDLGGYHYSSRPDLVATLDPPLPPVGTIGPSYHHTKRTTWDIKLKTFNQAKTGDTWYVKPELSTFDDQCLGQAICAGADAFGQIQFWVGKKDGVVIGPIYVEQPVSAVLAKEWEKETMIECAEIAGWRQPIAPYFDVDPWPKNDQACHSFGRPCPHLQACNFGFETKPLDKPKGKD